MDPGRPWRPRVFNIVDTKNWKKFHHQREEKLLPDQTHQFSAFRSPFIWRFALAAFAQATERSALVVSTTAKWPAGIRAATPNRPIERMPTQIKISSKLTPPTIHLFSAYYAHRRSPPSRPSLAITRASGYGVSHCVFCVCDDCFIRHILGDSCYACVKGLITIQRVSGFNQFGNLSFSSTLGSDHQSILGPAAA